MHPVWNNHDEDRLAVSLKPHVEAFMVTMVGNEV